MREMKADQPFDIQAAVIMPEHLHFIWSLPPGDDGYSKRIGRMKVLFTRAFREERVPLQGISASRRKHQESNVWQRRFWEHTISDEEECERCFDYIHYNPVKHGLVRCPHRWEASSFHQWVERGAYEAHWGCCCDGRKSKKLSFADLEDKVRE